MSEDMKFVQPEPTSDTIRKFAHEQGYTDLRFNPATRSWAWHKPDQAVGADGRLYIRAQSQS